MNTTNIKDPTLSKLGTLLKFQSIFIFLFLFFPCVVKSQTTVVSVSTLTQLQSYTGTATSIVVADATRGGVFNLVTGSTTPDNGITFSSSISGTYWKRQTSDSNIIIASWYPVDPSGSVDSTPYLQAAITAAGTGGVGGTPGIVYIPTGTYKITGLSINVWNVSIRGAGVYSTVLKTTMDTSVTALKIATTANVQFITLSDISIQGNSSNKGAIALGTASYLVAAFSATRVQTIGFSRTGAFGYSLNSVQQADIVDCDVDGNYYNVYRPVTGFCTTTTFQGHKGILARSIAASVYLAGRTEHIIFRDIVFQTDKLEAIRTTGPGSWVTVDNCYFEASNVTGGAAAVIDMSSGSLTAENNTFAAPTPGHSLYSIKLDTTFAHINNNYGLWTNGGVSTTANSIVDFNKNNVLSTDVPALSQIQSLPGEITADEIPNGNSRYILNPGTFYGVTSFSSAGGGGNNAVTINKVDGTGRTLTLQYAGVSTNSFSNTGDIALRNLNPSGNVNLVNNKSISGFATDASIHPMLTPAVDNSLVLSSVGGGINFSSKDLVTLLMNIAESGGVTIPIGGLKITALTASKPLFTNSSSTLTTTGPGTTSQLFDATGAIITQLPSSFINYQHTISAPSSGSTITLTNHQYNVINPSGAIAALTFVMPSSPVNGDILFVKFTQPVTTITWPSSVKGAASNAGADTMVTLTYDSASGFWY